MKTALSKPARIRRILFDRIASGKYPKEKPLPSERELSESFEVSMATVREAVSLLVSDGCLRRIQGKGTFISSSMAPNSRGMKAVNIYASDSEGMRERDPFVSELLCGVHRALSKSSGLPVRFVPLADGPGGFSEAFRLNEVEYMACGALFAACSLSEADNDLLRSAGIKAASVGRIEEAKGLPFVEVDHFKGAAKAVGELAALGHKRIALMDLSKPMPYLASRRAGFERAIAEHACESRFIPLANFTMAEAQKSFGEFLSSGFQATGLVCVGDRPSVAAFKLLAERGLKVPADVSIISYSDYAWIDDACGLVFSKVSQSADSLAEDACRILLGETPQTEIWHDTRFTGGESCAKAKTQESP